VSDLQALASYARSTAAPRPSPCELCGAPIAPEHRHVVDLETRTIQCSCGNCAVLFDREDGRYRRVPEEVRRAKPIDAERWTVLGVPVRLAFVFMNSRLGAPFACYPSPAGNIESKVDADRFRALGESDPAVGALLPDVQALVGWGPRGTRDLECFVAPIDSCYELAGLCRTRWRGFDGGDDVRQGIEKFFARLRARAS
jgi:hypothetical protein